MLGHTTTARRVRANNVQQAKAVRESGETRRVWPEECLATSGATMSKHDHHKAAAHHDEAAKSHRNAAEAHEKGDHADASQHSQIANDHSAKAHEASQSAHGKTKGPKKL